MSTTVTPSQGKQLWGIYYTDREYAREVGDPLRTVIEAPTKQAAEETAGKLGFESPWAHPVTTEQSRNAQWLPPRKQRHPAIADAQTFTRHPRLTMRTPTTAQVRTAIEVLNKLEERID